jgi:hypothetical protein
MARFNPTCFDTANPLYAGATVTIYTVDGNGAATTTLATIYDGTTGTGTLANPQTLNSEGRFSAPIYLAEPVIMTISGPVTTHSTGIQAPSVRNRGTWATATLYAEGDIVRDGAAGANTGNTYLCEVRHTSGTWATDLTAVRWSLLTDLSTQTAAAAASAAAADASAIAAAASAASITIPLPIASGGTGAANAASALAALGGQPLDSDLTAIAALTTTAFGRGLLELANAAAALSAIGAEDAALNHGYLDVSQSWTAGQTPLTAALTDGATVNWNAANAQFATLTAAAARTFAAPTNLVANRWYALVITNSGGAWAHAFNAAFIFDTNDGTPTAAASGGKLILTFVSDGTSLREAGRRYLAS